MDIPIDAEVECADGPCGRSTYIILRPANEEVTHIVVRERESPHHEFLVPVREITETGPDFVRLGCTSAGLARMRAFVETEFLEVDIPQYSGDPYLMHPYMIPEPTTVTVKHKSIPEGELSVRRGARVEATDGKTGQVDEFLVKPGTDEITHLILREGHLWGQKEVAVPVARIDGFRDGAVFLTLSKQEIAELPSIAMRRRPLSIPTSVELRCNGEPCGYLDYYILVPSTPKVSHIVARPTTRSYLEYLVPVQLVTETEPGVVSLSCSGEELTKMEPFLETVYVSEELSAVDPALEGQPLPAYRETGFAYSAEPVEVAVERRRMPLGGTAMCPGAQVLAADGVIGKLDGFMMEPHTGQITYLVLRRGHMWGQQDIMIPATEIDRFAENAIHLTVDKRSVSTLPAVAVERRPK